jgi:large subunit ribosomal protein L17
LKRSASLRRRQGQQYAHRRTGLQISDGDEKAFIELLGAEKQLDAKPQKRMDVKAKNRAELERELEESKKENEKAGRGRVGSSLTVSALG